MTYGFKMANDVTDLRAMGMVKEVEEDLNRAIKVINKYSFVDGNLTLF
jgi:hypothetical protein